MIFFKGHKQTYPKEQLELHKTALELKGIAINLQRTVDEFHDLVLELKAPHQTEYEIRPRGSE